MARNDPTVKYSQLSGLADANPDYEVGIRALSLGENIDISRGLRARRRPGYSQVLDSPVDAVWGDDASALFVSDGELYRFDGVMAALLGSVQGEVTYLHAVSLPLGRIVWTTGNDVGVVLGSEFRALGIPDPPDPTITVEATGGGLREGLYTISVTLTRDGFEEGGASPVYPVVVPAGASITVLPTAVAGYKTNVYISTPDGSQSYLIATVDGGQSFTISSNAMRSLGTPLMTRGHGVPPFPPSTVAVSGGRLLYAMGPTLWYSSPFNYELFDLRSGFIQFPEDITVIAPVDNGVFVATSQRHIYLEGPDIASARWRERASYGAPLCQPVMIESDEHGLEGVPSRVALWTSKQGFVGASENGVLFNLSQGKVRFAPGLDGSLAVRRSNGRVHVLATVRY